MRAIVLLICVVYLELSLGENDDVLHPLENQNRNSSSSRPIAAKCCPMGKILILGRTGTYVCEPKPYRCPNKSIADLRIWTEDLVDTKYNVGQLMTVVQWNKSYMGPDVIDYSIAFKEYKPKLKFLKDGSLIIDRANVYPRTQIIPVWSFCAEILFRPGPSKINPIFFGSFDADSNIKDTEKDLEPTNITITVAFVINALAYLLVLFVYITVPELRRGLRNQIIKQYLFNNHVLYLIGSILKIMNHYDPVKESVCFTTTFLIYNFRISSFVWSNILCLDNWITARSIEVKAEKVFKIKIYKYEKRIFRKFVWYFIYGHGLPLSMTISILVLNFVDLTKYRWFIKPWAIRSGCFISGMEMHLYLHLPIAILLMMNLIFFMLTLKEIRLMSKNSAILNRLSKRGGKKTPHASSKKRLLGGKRTGGEETIGDSETENLSTYRSSIESSIRMNGTRQSVNNAPM